MNVRRLCRFLVVAGGLIPATLAAAADAGPRPSPSQPATSPLLVDLVVRDRKGAPLADLRAEEVELLEDGVKQAVEEFRRVGGAPAAAGQPEPARLVVFLFPRLDGAQRDLARNAAEEFVKKHLGPGVSVAVLVVGAELVPIQGFTANPAELRQAIARALGPGAGAGDPDVRSLYSLVRWLEGQPGRKTALLFASALAVPPGFEDSLHQVLGLANQQRVSFYGIDPRGIEISRGGMQADQASQGLSTELWGMGGGSKVGADLRGYGQSFGPTFQGASPQALARLANGSGGFVSEPTNSFSKVMRQVAEDANGYYELRYTPTRDKPAGEFRKLEVRVARDEARVQARQEFLVGELATALVPAFEKQLAEALEADPPASAVELWQRPLHFAWDGRELEHALWVALPLEKVSLVEDAAAGRFEGEVSILARVKDASGKVAASFSQRFPISGPLDQLARARTLSLPFVRRLKLQPGDYVLETAVRDGRAEATGVERTPLVVRAPQGIGLSSLSLGDLLPAAAGGDPDDPLRIGDKRLIPNLGQPIKAGQAAMTLYSAVYPAAASKEPAQIEITLLLGGQPANNASAMLPAPDQSGKIAYATALRMDVLPPGSYRFKVAVTQGASRAEESLSFTVVP